MIMLRIVSRTA